MQAGIADLGATIENVRIRSLSPVGLLHSKLQVIVQV